MLRFKKLYLEVLIVKYKKERIRIIRKRREDAK
jgi:hypothetical protein